MKRLILSLLFISQIVTGQSLTVTGDALVNLNFSTALNGQLDTLNPCLPTHASLTIKNVSDKDHDVVCEKNVLISSDGMEDHFCWGGTCYGSSTIVSTETTNIQSGQADDIEFDGVFDAYCNIGYAVVEYCFYPEGASADRACFIITYNNDVAVGITLDKTLDKNMSNFYPNPARDIVSFSYRTSSVSELVFIDILGNEVKRVFLCDKGTQTLDVSDFSKGIYFGNVIVNNQIVAIKKLIVR
jgi:hypothetical protein